MVTLEAQVTAVVHMPRKHRFDHKKLRRIRQDLGWSETELAARVGVTAPAVRKWETGKSTPGLLVFLDLCEVLEVEVEDLTDRAPRSE